MFCLTSDKKVTNEAILQTNIFKFFCKIDKWSNGESFDLASLLTLQLSFFLKVRSGMLLRGKNIRSWCDRSLDRFFMVDPFSYFSFQPLLHDWCNKGCGMCYSVCDMVHIKDSLLLIKEYPMKWWQRVFYLAI